MARIPKPWFREQTQSWYVKIDGTQHPLGKDKEEDTGIAPPYGVIVLGDKSRVEVRNTPQLRQWVLGIADQIRASRQRIEEPIPVRQPAAKCRACGMREGCGQRSA